MFSCQLCEISKNTFSTEHLQPIASENSIWILNKVTKKTKQANKQEKQQTRATWVKWGYLSYIILFDIIYE